MNSEGWRRLNPKGQRLFQLSFYSQQGKKPDKKMGFVMICEKDWIDIFSALLTPIIAIAVAVIAFMQWRTNEWKRKQDLFDKRYDFYQRLREVYLAHHGTNPSQFHEPALEPFIEEATFLFGADISQHIESFYNYTYEDLYVSEDSEWNLHPTPDSAFIRPFKKYMQLK